jgi:hypothetical protein
MIYTDGTPTIAMTDALPLSQLILLRDYINSIHDTLEIVDMMDGNVYVELDAIRAVAGKFFEDLAEVVNQTD